VIKNARYFWERITNFLALNKTNHRTILSQFWGNPKTLGGAHHVGTFEGFHWELWQQQLPKSWYITSMETNLGTTWLSYHGACCPDLALKVIILIIGKIWEKIWLFNWESIEDQLGTSL